MAEFEEKLSIHNFFSIEKFDWNINNLNFLIGPMGSGKSVCMKLVYFFENSPYYLKDADPKDISKELNKWFKDILNIEEFKKCNFNKKTKLVYIFREKTDNFDPHKNDIFNLTGKWNGKDLVWSFQKEYKQKIKDIKKIKEYLNDWSRIEGKPIFPFTPIFIPACRANASTKKLGKHCKFKNGRIEECKEEYIDKDFFLKRFLEFKKQTLENLKKEDFVEKAKLDDMKNIFGIDEIKIEADEIIFEKKIGTSVKQYKLPFLASGQQESLYLLPFIAGTDIVSPSKLNSLFIEEPSAYLFPENQLEVIKFLIKKLKGAMDANYESAFFISTHSTFFIDMINSAMLNQEIENSKGKKLNCVPAFCKENVSVFEILKKGERYTIEEKKHIKGTYPYYKIGVINEVIDNIIKDNEKILKKLQKGKKNLKK